MNTAKISYKQLLLILCLLPTVLLVALLLLRQPGEEIGAHDVVTLTMTDANDNVFSFSSANEAHAPMLALLNELLSSEEKSDVEQQVLLNSTAAQSFTLVRTVNGKDTITYRLYFLPTDTGFSLYFHESSRLLSMRKASSDALNRFLNTDYAASLYNAERTPRLRLSSGEEVLPSELIWYYRFGQELVSQKDVVRIDEDMVTYAVSGQLEMALTPTPSECTVMITGSSGAIRFNGTLQDLSSAAFEITEPLSVSVRATWLPGEEQTFSGIVNYQFELKHIEPADFVLNTDVSYMGGLLRVTGVNITNPERIRCSLENTAQTLTYSFYPMENTAFGYIVLPEDLMLGEYTLRIDYGTYSKRIVLFVRAKTIDPLTYEVLDESIEIASLKQSLLQERILIQKRASEITSILFPHDHWQDPASREGCTLLSHKGMVIVAKPSGESFTREGNQYRMEHGAKISCIAGGVVLEKGYNEYDGYYVLVDHGGGVVSRYSNVAQTTVEKGWIVREGDTVALAGKSGLTGNDGFVLSVLLQGTPISPDALWK